MTMEYPTGGSKDEIAANATIVGTEEVFLRELSPFLRAKGFPNTELLNEMEDLLQARAIMMIRTVNEVHYLAAIRDALCKVVGEGKRSS